MKLTLKLIYRILGMLTGTPLCAQTHQIIDIEQLLTNLSQTENIELNYDDIYQQLIHMMEAPFDLNQVSENELSSLPFFGEPPDPYPFKLPSSARLVLQFI